MRLEVKNLSAAFQQPVLHDVTFSVPEGKIVALVGASGSGKTMTALSILGLLPWYQGKMTQGEMVYNNTVCLTSLSEREWQKIRGREIGMILQNPVTALNPVIRIGRQLREVMKMRDKALSGKALQEQLEALLQRVELNDVQRICRSYPFELSGGMCQRVMIGMALCQHPSLLIADEPTSDLDRHNERQILCLLQEINHTEGCSILLITHDLKIASQYADEIVVMHQGRVVESGKAEAVFRSPQHAYTAGLLKAIF